MQNTSLIPNTQDYKGLTLAKAREILNDTLTSDQQLQNVVDAVNLFCKITYEHYQSQCSEKAKIISINPQRDLRQAA